jgi:predicted transposase/invertase (TIGR01784 family)
MYTKEELERNTILEDEKKEAREEGHKEGVKERNIEIAKKMIIKGLKLKDIIEFTSLTKEEIEKIKEEI